MTAPRVDIALGTVQFGLAYGIAGTGAAVADAEARAIFEQAAARGIRRLDTAPAYGDIEERLARLTQGLDVEIVSKVAAVPDALTGEAAVQFVTDSLQRSQARLGDKLCGILFHRADDLMRDDGDRLWEAAATWGAANGVAIGASCYDPATLLALTRRWPVAMAQLPGNALDQRLGEAADALDGVEVTIRSVFLQGLLLMPRDAAERRLPAAAGAMALWHDWCRSQGRSPLAAALAFAKGIAGVRYCVVGVDRVEQLDEIADAWGDVEPVVDARMAMTDPAVIDPRFWKVAA